MTAVCGGGASTPRPGMPALIEDSANAIAAALALLGFEVPAAVAALISPVTRITTSTFCANDPPADPGLTATDLINAFEFTLPGVSLPAINKIAQWWLSQRWYDVCQCSAVTTPAPPSPSNPGNPVGNNSGLPSGPTTPPCWSVTFSDQFPHYSSPTTTPPITRNDVGLPSGATLAVNNHYSGLADTAVAIPAGVNNLTLHSQSSIAVSGVQESLSAVYFYDNTGTYVGLLSAVCCGTAFPNPATLAAIPAGATYWLIDHLNQNSVQASSVTTEFSFYCSGQSPTGVVTECCPPDPILETLLNQILALETAIYQSLPTPVSSWAESTAHSGLSGHGSIGLSGNAIAVKVTLTTIPSWVGVDIASPTFYFDAGFVTFTTVEGSYSSNRVTYSPQVFSVPLLGYQLDYTLENGCVATVTELTRGP